MCDVNHGLDIIKEGNVCVFKRRISVASHAIQTIDNEITYLINYGLYCFDATEIRRLKRALFMT